MRKHYSFGSTPGFPNLLKQVRALTDPNGRFEFAGWHPDDGIDPTEEQKELLASYQPTMPILTFTGSEKLHGQNLAVAYNSSGYWVQGRNHIRTLLSDQNGMAAYVEEHRAYFMTLILHLVDYYNINTDTHTLIIDGEWAGGSIQGSNAACSGTDKAMYIFDYIRVVDNESGNQQYLSVPTLTAYLGSTPYYFMKQFHTYTITLDFANPRNAEHSLKLLAEHIEDNSPIADYHDKPDNVGEGAYLWCEYNGEMLRLKAKGEKHGGKPKQPRKPKQPITDEQRLVIETLANEVTPVWRITQGITETGATERSHTGSVIGWVMKDIIKEDMDKVSSSGLTLKQLNGTIASIVSTYFHESIKGY